MVQQLLEPSSILVENQQSTNPKPEQVIADGLVTYTSEIPSQRNTKLIGNTLLSTANNEHLLNLSTSTTRNPLHMDQPSGRSNAQTGSIPVDTTPPQSPRNGLFACALEHNDGVEQPTHEEQGDFELFGSFSSSDMSDKIIDMLLGRDGGPFTPATDVSESSGVCVGGHVQSLREIDGDDKMQSDTKVPDKPCGYMTAIWYRPPLPPGLRSACPRISKRTRKSDSNHLIPLPKPLFRKESMSSHTIRERHHITLNFHHDRALRYRVFKRSSLARETILSRAFHVSSKLAYYNFKYRVRGGNGIQGDDMIGDGFNGDGRRLCEGCNDTVCLWENMTPVQYVNETCDGAGS
ncbi:hypothetical protein BGZ60DRAFT_541182 [Tricladium varicosporioides]|nr:hypothetical protein BGZ60DRAFT_541182 [Hymenoscyphus varicosporioides]